MIHSLHQLNQTGDNNGAVYITKKIALENPATALKVFFAGNKVGTSDIKVLFKILRSDLLLTLMNLDMNFLTPLVYQIKLSQHL